jgi:hypothetical protein
MAIRSAPHPYARPGPDLGRRDHAGLTVIDGSRGKPDVLLIRASEVADLIDELTAAGMDMVAMSARLEIAFGAGRLDLIPDIAARLRRLGVQYRDCTKPGGAA